MIKTGLKVLVLLLALSGIVPLASQTRTGNQLSSITLYSPLRHWTPANRDTQRDRGREHFSLVSGSYRTREDEWDLSYGRIYVGADRDWFQLNGTRTNRSVIKDLGEHSWSDRLKISALQPLAPLREGEERHLTIDASGQPGADGVDGMNAGEQDILRASSTGAINRGAIRVGSDAPDFPGALSSVPGWKPKTKQVKNPPVLAKAVRNHMYLVHRVDAQTDAYFLVHVDAVVSGDNCTISWKQISAPN